MDLKLGRESQMLYVADVKIVKLLEQVDEVDEDQDQEEGRLTRKQRSSWCNRPTPPAED